MKRYTPVIWLCCCILLTGQLFAQDTVRTGSRLREYIAPAAFISYGIWCTGNGGFPSSNVVRTFRNEYFPNFHTSIDDYIVFAPAAAVYTLDLLNVKSTNNPINQTILFAKTSALTLATVYGLKYLTTEQRPNKSNNYSFPSAHTAFAFAYATVLHEEFKNQSVWVSVAGYTAASAVGAMRIANDAHWLNDVLVGAGIGIVSTKLVYLTHAHRYKSNWPKKSAILPNIGNQYYGMVWLHTF